ncbi:MAG TPA: DUF3617 domain-containing protein [Rhizomicrobium sp.]
MRRLGRIAAAVLLAGSSTAALAAHGKAGLWSTTTTMTMSGMEGMKMPPQTHAGTFCMTQQAVNADAPPKPESPSCQVQNVRHAGNTVSADMVCHGQMEATGHFSTTYDSDTHYRAQMSMAMQGMTMNNAIEGKWLKADCAGATP